MGAKELSQYIHIRIKELGISKTKVIERAHISRNGFYKILDERTTDEIKLSTLIRNIPAWENRRLVCQDEDLIVTKKSGGNSGALIFNFGKPDSLGKGNTYSHHTP